MTTYCLICAPNIIPDDATFSLGKHCLNCGMNMDLLQIAVTLVHMEDFEPMDDSDQDNSLAWTEHLDDHDNYVYTDAVVEAEPEWVYVPDTLNDYTE
jgi:hypothetical protein